MNTVSRFAAALGLALAFGTTAAFAQTPPKTTAVKAHSFMNKKGHMVNVKAHTRVVPAKKTTMVKAHSFVNKKGTLVKVKAHSRMMPAKKSAKPTM